jgi:DNA-binding transcriptional regulator YiaG
MAGAVEAAARADRDAQPLTAGDLKPMKRTPQAKIIRRALALTQEEFAVRYHSPSALSATGSKAARSRTGQRRLI